MTSGPYVSRFTRMLRVVLLLSCALFGTIAAILGIVILAMVRATGWGMLILGIGVGLIGLAFYKKDRWHTAEERLQW